MSHKFFLLIKLDSYEFPTHTRNMFCKLSIAPKLQSKNINPKICWAILEPGVYQGTVLGPIFYIFYANVFKSELVKCFQPDQFKLMHFWGKRFEYFDDTGYSDDEVTSSISS